LNKNRQTGHTEHKREGNVHANKALTYALGLRSDDRSNSSCCHIWGVGDAAYQEANAVVQNNSFYSCVANMVLLPTPLKAFTDTMPEVKAMLRICACRLYGWHCDHESQAGTIARIDAWGDWDAYPKSWPRGDAPVIPLGTVRLNDEIKGGAQRRGRQIRKGLATARRFYPREKVKAAPNYWKIPYDEATSTESNYIGGITPLAVLASHEPEFELNKLVKPDAIGQLH
jgi:hypothetical protein